MMVSESRLDHLTCMTVNEVIRNGTLLAPVMWDIDTRQTAEVGICS